ncbi:nonstructural protein [Microviridae sp.]|nr:nonstructural protein [Microviridae sp.]
MLKKIFAIYDEKSEAYLQPFFMDTNGQAIRAITDCLSDPDHNFARHPSDYTLFIIGEFDNNTASIDSFKTSLGNLVEFKPKVAQLHSITGDLEQGDNK